MCGASRATTMRWRANHMMMTAMNKAGVRNVASATTKSNTRAVIRRSQKSSVTSFRTRAARGSGATVISVSRTAFRGHGGPGSGRSAVSQSQRSFSVLVGRDRTSTLSMASARRRGDPGRSIKTFATAISAGGLELQIGVDHHFDEFFKAYLWLPAELTLCLATVRQQPIHFRGTKEALINHE